ncbi:MAG: M1 family metallopeptidase [Flavobacterium sp.]|jgi:aminopeptidase N|nr:M1 family metallopeptidase [Flavobacterium sp.]
MKYLILFISVFSFAQQTKSVDFTSVLAKIEINPLNKSVSGEVTYNFEVNNTIDTIKIDAQNIDFFNLKINNIGVKYSNNRKQILLFEGYKSGKNQLTFNYLARPKQALYFVGKGEQLQIWTQGQGKYTSNWFPSFDNPNEKLIFNLDIKFNNQFEVISNGKLENKIAIQDDIIWQYRMKKPMSSYLLMLAIGKFEIKQEKSNSGKSLFYYIEKEDISKLEPTYRYSKTIFDFFEKEIGVKYPWDVYKQVPVRDFLYAGMENTSATVFSRYFVVDEIGFNDKNYVNVNAHELAHQWFGDLITAQSGKHHWLQEGFATYYALLAEKEVFGDDYFYKKLYDTSLQLRNASKTDAIPILSEKASTLSYYQKGAWVLFVLREEIGSKVFQKAVKNYLNNYSFKNVTTDDFLNEINKIAKYDCDAFKKKWLENPSFDFDYAIQLLSKNKSIKALLEIKSKKAIPFIEKRELFEKTMISDAYFPIKEEIIFQCEKVPFEEKLQLIKLALAINDINVRQAVANTTPKVQLEFKLDFETLLNDNSYITKEITLSTFWTQFPEDQKRILDKSKAWIGFNDKNLRILWLTLALGTKEYQMEDKAKYYDELLNYCNPEFETSIRQNAMENLLFINDKDKNVLPNLVNSLVSYKWQFSKFGKDKIRLLLKNPNIRNYLEQLLPNLSKEENLFLVKILAETAVK